MALTGSQPHRSAQSWMERIVVLCTVRAPGGFERSANIRARPEEVLRPVQLQALVARLWRMTRSQVQALDLRLVDERDDYPAVLHRQTLLDVGVLAAVWQCAKVRERRVRPARARRGSPQRVARGSPQRVARGSPQRAARAVLPD